MTTRALPGASEPDRPGRGSNAPIAPLYMKPRPSVTTPDGVPSVSVSETHIPLRSTTHTCVVSAASRAASRGTPVFSPRPMRAAIAAACDFDNSRSAGTSTKRGSPRFWSRSTAPIFIASATIAM